MTGSNLARRACTLVTMSIVASFAMACASTPSGEDAYADPLEGMNRGVFRFNETIDRWALEPAAKGWDYVVPDPVQRALDRFYQNLGAPVDIVNNFLQAKMENACMVSLRFVINSSVGLAGFFDPSTSLGLVRHDEDFGQTLAVYGAPNGPFLILPLLGPSTPRDVVGIAADSPLAVYNFFVPALATAGVQAARLINTRARLLDPIRQSREDSLDYYVFVRNAYVDYRRNQVLDGVDTNDPADEGLYEIHDDAP